MQAELDQTLFSPTAAFMSHCICVTFALTTILGVR